MAKQVWRARNRRSYSFFTTAHRRPLQPTVRSWTDWGISTSGYNSSGDNFLDVIGGRCQRAGASTGAIPGPGAQLNCQSALPTFKNTPQSATVQCTTDDPNAPTPTGGPVTANIPAGQYTSNVSQTDANSQALAAAQAMAESQLSGQCTWSNSPQSYTATCPTGETGSPVTKMVAAGVFTSTISQADANSQALTSATNQANAALVCNGSSPTVYQNTQQQVCITKRASCLVGIEVLFGSVEICVTVSPNQFTSIISQANANQLAINAATTKAGNYIPPQTTQCSSTVNLTIP